MWLVISGRWQRRWQAKKEGKSTWTEQQLSSKSLCSFNSESVPSLSVCLSAFDQTHTHTHYTVLRQCSPSFHVHSLIRIHSHSFIHSFHCTFFTLPLLLLHFPCSVFRLQSSGGVDSNIQLLNWAELNWAEQHNTRSTDPHKGRRQQRRENSLQQLRRRLKKQKQKHLLHSFPTQTDSQPVN